MARFPQFYSRIGFVHEFRPLGTSEMQLLLERHWTPSGVHLPQDPLPSEVTAAIIRMTAGNFRLLNRLLSQIEGSPQNTDINARLGVCASIKSMIYSRALRTMEVPRARHNKLFIFSKGCCLPYSMIRILKRPLTIFAVPGNDQMEVFGWMWPVPPQGPVGMTHPVGEP